MATDHDSALSLQYQSQSARGELAPERLREIEENSLIDAQAVRHSYGIAFALVTATILVGMITGKALSVWWPAPKPGVVILQMAAAGVLLVATLGFLGWEIQTVKGQTLAEKTNRWLFRLLYVIGTYLFVVATAWSW